MKLVANLYTTELQPYVERYSLNVVAASIAGAAVLMLVMAVVANVLAAQQQAAKQELAEQVTQLQQRVTTKQQALQQALNDANLKHQISQLTTQLKQRERLLTQMRQVTETGQTSFGEILNDLARADRSNIWLHRILIANNQLTLQGYTTQARALPQWLSSFPTYDTLKDRSFGVFELRDTNMGTLEFTVGSGEHSKLLQVHPVQTQSRGASR
jgi:Tfp pilus assembly protein PilN